MDVYKSIIGEFREGYQIPPYVTDSQIEVLAKESHAYLKSLNPEFDIDSDDTGRNLMKNRMFYAFNHQDYQFGDDYREDIVTWQMSFVGEKNEIEE